MTLRTRDFFLGLAGIVAVVIACVLAWVAVLLTFAWLIAHPAAILLAVAAPCGLVLGRHWRWKIQRRRAPRGRMIGGPR